MRFWETDSYNNLISKAKGNKQQDELDTIPIENKAVKTQFEPRQQGKFAKEGVLQGKFRAASLMAKKLPMPQRKRFGVVDIEVMQA